MALTPSTMLILGTKAPAFELVNAVDGTVIRSVDYVGERGFLVMFICNHCPYVIHLKEAMAELARDAQARGFGVVAISSNDVTNPKYADDRPEKMKEDAEQFGYSFPYCFDEAQAVAKAYQAACTPDLYVFDQQHHCVYRGRFDNSTPGNGQPVTGIDLRQALDRVLSGQPHLTTQLPSMGCNIKWRKNI